MEIHLKVRVNRVFWQWIKIKLCGSPTLYVMNHFISLQEAIDMTRLYRSNYEQILQPAYQHQGILALSEAFDRNAFDVLLAKPGCCGLRIYYGMSTDFKVHAVIVPYDADGKDILPETTSALRTTEGQDIVERGNRCPDICPDESVLNS